jgi:hypothetical protein
MASNNTPLPFRSYPQTAPRTPNQTALTARAQREEILTSRSHEDYLSDVCGTSIKSTPTLLPHAAAPNFLTDEYTDIAEIAYVPHYYHHVAFTCSRVPPQPGAERPVAYSYLLRITGYTNEANQGGKVLHEVGASEEMMLSFAYEMLKKEVRKAVGDLIGE